MPAFSNNRQLILMEEFAPGVVRDGFLTNPAYAEMVLVEASLSLTVTYFDSERLRESLTPAMGTVELRGVVVDVVTELVGPSAAQVAYPPKWTTLLRGSGFHEEPIFQHKVTAAGILDAAGAAGGVLRHDELIVSGSYRHRVMGTAFDGDEYVYTTREIANLPSTTPLVGASTGAQFQIQTTGSRGYGFAYFPVSLPIQKSHVVVGGGAPADFGSMAVGDLVEFRDPSTGANHCRGVFVEPVPPTGSSANALLFRLVRGYAEYDDQVWYWSKTTETWVDTGRAVEPSGSTVPTQYMPVAPMYYSESDTLAGSFFLGGNIVTGKAMRGNFSISAEVNQAVMLKWSGRGLLDDAPASENGGIGSWPAPMGIPYNEREPVRFAGSTVKVARVGAAHAGEALMSLCVKSLDFDMGNTVSPRRCASEPEGVLEMWLTSRAPELTLVLEANLEADIPWLGSLTAGTDLRLEWLVGSGDYDSFRFTWPALTVASVERDADDGLALRSITLRATGGDLYNLDGTAPVLPRTGGDNEFVIHYRGLASAWF